MIKRYRGLIGIFWWVGPGTVLGLDDQATRKTNVLDRYVLALTTTELVTCPKWTIISAKTESGIKTYLVSVGETNRD